MKVLPTMGSMYSGSLRGITAGHNKGGLYFRGRTVPTNPNTARQQLIRSVMNGIVQTWSDILSEPQRQAWRDYAANVPVQDSLGQTMTLSGVNWFVKSQSIPRQGTASGLVGSNAVETLDAPVIFNTGESVVSVDTFSADFTTPPGTLTVNGEMNAPPTDDGVNFLFLAPPQTPGTRFYKGPYQLASIGTVTENTPNWPIVADLSEATEWIADTTPVPAWDQLFIPLKIVTQYVDGRRAEEFRELVQFTDATP